MGHLTFSYLHKSVSLFPVGRYLKRLTRGAEAGSRLGLARLARSARLDSKSGLARCSAWFEARLDWRLGFAGGSAWLEARFISRLGLAHLGLVVRLSLKTRFWFH